MEELQKIIERAVGSNAHKIAISSSVSIGIIIAGLVIALGICFFGLKLKRILAFLAALLVGVVVAAATVILLNLNQMTSLIVGVIIVILFCVLSMVFIRFGVFLLMAFYVFSLGAVIFYHASPVVLVVWSAITLVVAILAAIFMDPFIMIVTGIFGGLSAGQYIAMLLKVQDNLIMVYGMSIAIAIIGIIIQFTMHSRKLIAKESKKAGKISEESMESEVKKARLILEDYENDEEEEETLDK
ncbi:MAG TPA: hypothetical protein H9887_02790 [Candidatus Dorea intestinavium]|nr:hypothetical protein [Candidatus Dorea intestinavium]